MPLPRYSPPPLILPRASSLPSALAFRSIPIRPFATLPFVRSSLEDPAEKQDYSCDNEANRYRLAFLPYFLSFLLAHLYYGAAPIREYYTTMHHVPGSTLHALRDGHNLSVSILDDDQVGGNDLSSVHEDDRGLVQRVGTHSATLHEGSVGARSQQERRREITRGSSPAEDDGKVRVLDEHDLLLDRLLADL